MSKSAKNSALNKTKTSTATKTKTATNKTKTASTKIDLGDDLLENSGSFTDTKSKESRTFTQTKINASDEELLSSAEILFNEGIYDESKRIFRKILRKDPTNLKVKNFLEKIQKKEIADLLSSEGRVLAKLSESVEINNTSDIINSLSKDLRINIDRDDLKIIPDLFVDEFSYNKYINKIKKVALQINPRDAMDFGIAYFEMGLYPVAKEIFEGLIGLDHYRFSALYLLGLCLIHNGESIEATIRLEPYVRDINLDEDLKVDFLYLMGLAFEHMKETLKSREFFRRVYLLNPKYRDVAEKIRS